MVRTQIQLSEEDHRRLKDLAGKRGVSVAEVVREGVQKVLADSDREDRWARLLAAAGTGGPDIEGATDVSERHDEYLAEIWAHDHDIR